jgi:anti-sigma B factor antagonist
VTPTLIEKNDTSLATSERASEGDAFSIRTEPDGDALVVRAFGEVDIASAKTLEKELRQAFENGASTVLLDLGNVEFIDATGLSVLLAVVKLTTANRRELRIVRLSWPVERAVKLTGLEGSSPFPG